jgi:hypothetical protein
MFKALKATWIAHGPIERQDSLRALTGRYNIANRKRLRTNAREFFACRATNISPFAMKLTVPVIGYVGDSITAQFDELGEIKGTTTRISHRGLEFNIKATAEERAKLTTKIEWLKKNKQQAAAETREYRRLVPREPISTLIFADGSTPRCFVIDMSPVSAAVSASTVPAVGTPVAVGKIIGRVSRHLSDGFVIHFLQDQDLDHLERLLIKPVLKRENHLRG